MASRREISSEFFSPFFGNSCPSFYGICARICLVLEKKSFFRGNADIGEGILLSAIGPPSILATASVSAVVFSSSAGDSRKHRFIASCPVSTTSSYPESIAREEDTGHSRPQCQAGTFSANETKKFTVLNTALNK